MREIILIAHNIRSCHNVGSLLRTAEGLGAYVYLTGYTPYPLLPSDNRLPHQSLKIQKQIQKTALGAEDQPIWSHASDPKQIIAQHKRDGFLVVALEQSNDSTPLHEYQPNQKVAVLLGEEVAGINPELMSLCDEIIEIPMFGVKESFNVVQAAAMTLFYLRFAT
jgi:tRNA G18 (ribose-2'-O)-methylase SpoU